MIVFSIWFSGRWPGRTVGIRSTRELERAVAFMNRCIGPRAVRPRRFVALLPIRHLHHRFVPFPMYRTERRRLGPCWLGCRRVAIRSGIACWSIVVAVSRKKEPGSFADPGEPCLLFRVTIERHLSRTGSSHGETGAPLVIRRA